MCLAFLLWLSSLHVGTDRQTGCSLSLLSLRELFSPWCVSVGGVSGTQFSGVSYAAYALVKGPGKPDARCCALCTVQNAGYCSHPFCLWRFMAIGRQKHPKQMADFLGNGRQRGMKQTTLWLE